MIANIHDDGEPSLRSHFHRLASSGHPHANRFMDFDADEDALFRRLGRNITPARIWIRDTRGLYEISENPALVIKADTLCQIGVHLVPWSGEMGGRFCQIVSGPHQGVRFEFKAVDFFHAADLDE